MKAKTEEFLYLMFWAAELIARPTFRSVGESFEGWAYRNGLHQQLADLERRKWIESRGESRLNRVHRLTEAGRLAAIGGCDPVSRWKRRWDGQWRMILYDLPQKRASVRARLRRALIGRGFGFLQNSVWITPDPLTGERHALGAAEVDVEALILLEARPCAGESDLQIVTGAWNFAAINDAYDRHATVLESQPRAACCDETSARRWQRWLRDERLAWLEVTRVDPFLPERLHPPGYRGPKGWQSRLAVMAEAGKHIRSFKIESSG